MLVMQPDRINEVIDDLAGVKELRREYSLTRDQAIKLKAALEEHSLTAGKQWALIFVDNRKLYRGNYTMKNIFMVHSDLNRLASTYQNAVRDGKVGNSRVFVVDPYGDIVGNQSGYDVEENTEYLEQLIEDEGGKLVYSVR